MSRRYFFRDTRQLWGILSNLALCIYCIGFAFMSGQNSSDRQDLIRFYIERPVYLTLLLGFVAVHVAYDLLRYFQEGIILHEDYLEWVTMAGFERKRIYYTDIDSFRLKEFTSNIKNRQYLLIAGRDQIRIRETMAGFYNLANVISERHFTGADKRPYAPSGQVKVIEW